MTRIAAAIAALLAAIGAGAEDIPFVPGQGPAEALTDAERAAATLAIEALAADLQIANDGIVVDTIVAVDWRDSSIGCPKPGMAYMQVITPGHKIALQVADQTYVVHVADQRAVLCRQPPTAAIAEGVPPCECARLLGVRRMELAENRKSGPVGPTNEDSARSAGSASHTIYFLSLDCAGQVYLARVRGGTPGFRPKELSASDSLRIRIQGGKQFLSVDNGPGFEAILSPAALPARPESR